MILIKKGDSVKNTLRVLWDQQSLKTNRTKKPDIAIGLFCSIRFEYSERESSMTVIY